MARVGITHVLQACEFVGTHVIISLSMLKHVCTTRETKRMWEVVVGLYCIVNTKQHVCLNQKGVFRSILHSHKILRALGFSDFLLNLENVILEFCLKPRTDYYHNSTTSISMHVCVITNVVCLYSQ